jgi:uncharacterized protein
MRTVFVDTQYFIALLNRNDHWRETALKAQKETEGSGLVTTEVVLIEVLNFLCKQGPILRDRVVRFVHYVLEDVDFKVISQAEPMFLNGLELYESRLDKGYSLTDCISMNVCKELGISEVLTGDKHFQQEGLKILL